MTTPHIDILGEISSEISKDEIISLILTNRTCIGAAVPIINWYFPGTIKLHQQIFRDFIADKFCEKDLGSIIAFLQQGPAYLRKSVRNYCIDEVRKQNKHKKTVIELLDDQIIEAAEEYPIEKIKEIKKGIAKAFGEKKAIIIAMRIEGFESKEIAKRIGSTPQSIDVQVSRLRKNPEFKRIIHSII